EAARVHAAGDHVDEVLEAGAERDGGALDPAAHMAGRAICDDDVPGLGIGELPLQDAAVMRRLLGVEAGGYRLEEELHLFRVPRRGARLLAEIAGADQLLAPPRPLARRAGDGEDGRPRQLVYREAGTSHLRLQ